jgi:hypothetical protein
MDCILIFCDYLVTKRWEGPKLKVKLKEQMSLEHDRTADPYVDRRSGDERRVVYDSDYFENNGLERRQGGERRQRDERRDGCVRVSKWSSVCPDEM